MNHFNLKFKEEVAKLKEMNFKGKCEYIWEYYKFPITMTAIVLIICGSLINTWFINPPKKDYLYIAWMDNYAPETQLTILSEDLVAALSDNPEGETVTVSSFLTMDDSSYNVAMYNRLIAMISTAELDIFVMGIDSVLTMANAGYLASLDTLLAELTPLDGALTEQLRAAAVETEYQPSEGAPLERWMFAISLKDCQYLTSLGIYPDDLYLGVVVNTKKMDRVALALQFIYQ